MSIAEVKGSNPIQARFLFKTAKVASITAVIFFQIILHPAGLIINCNEYRTLAPD